MVRRSTKFDKGVKNTMNENLNQMVQEGTEPVRFSEEDLDLPQQEENNEDSVEAAPEQESPAQTVRTIPLIDWFENNVDNFDNISAVRLQIRGVNPKKTLVATVVDPTGELDEQGTPKRNLEFIRGADVQPVLNIPGSSLDIYGNGFRIIHNIGDIQLKGYGVKSGLEVTFCKVVNNLAIPYSMTKLKKKDTSLEIIPHPDSIEGWLQNAADREALTIAYRQSAKVIDTINTNQDIATFLCNRQAEIKDINHHIQIDKVFLTLQGI